MGEHPIDNKIHAYKVQFDAIFDDLVDELVAKDEKDVELGPSAAWLRKALQYNANGGKKSRGMMVIMCLDFLRGGKITDDEISKALILGWCVELLQAVFLVADDIMDQSELRRGKRCWYKECGLVAINDTFLMEACIYKLLRRHFSDTPYYVSVLESFHEITYITAMGQELDMLVSDPTQVLDLARFTMEKYKSIVKYKTAYYSFFLPISLGMRMAGITEEKMFEKARSILMELGEYFQIQDDYLDCYGDPAVTGKIGTDIQDGKCSWLIVKALEKCSDDDKELFRMNYGKHSADCIAEVKAAFSRLKLEQEFSNYEEQSRERILDLIDSQANGLPKGLFIQLVKKIYKRDK